MVGFGCLTTIYRFRGFVLEADIGEGTVISRYEDGASSGGGVCEEDYQHAEVLGITPYQYRLAHSLGDHLVAIASRRGDAMHGSPIADAAAHRRPVPAVAERLTRWTLAVTYLAHHASMPYEDQWDALAELATEGVDPVALAKRFRWCLGAAGLVRLVTIGGPLHLRGA